MANQETTENQSPLYQEARERLYKHVQEMHKEGFAAARGFDPQSTSERQKEYTGMIVKDYDKSITEAEKAGKGLYGNPDYAAGAKAGVREWAREQEREAEKQTVKIRVA
jgi:hypothetical protein